eukprot:9390571-Prorocentrum_lima.AAC.1
MAAPLNADWQYAQYLPAASTAPQVLTPNTASASTWPGLIPHAHSCVSEPSTYDVVMPDTGG